MMKISTIPKLCVTLMFLNLYVFTVVLKTTIPHCTQLTAIMALFFVLFGSIRNGKLLVRAYKGLYPTIVYFLFVLCSGCVLFFSNGFDISKTFGLFEMIVLGIIVCFICWYDKSYEFIYLLFILIATIDAVYAVVTAQGFNIRLELANNVSENTAGLLFLMGILGSCLTKNKLFTPYVKLIINIVMLIAIVLTGSRQALLQSALIYLYWFLPKIKNFFTTKKRISQLAFLCFLICLGIAFINSSLATDILDSKLVDRLTGENAATQTSDARRLELYSIGFDVMLSSPLYGNGYKNNPYTHSTYMEVLGGSGLIGFIIFFAPLIIRIKKIFDGMREAVLREEKQYFSSKLLCIVLLFVMMFFRAYHYYMPSFLLMILGMTDFDYEQTSKCKQDEHSSCLRNSKMKVR